MRDISGFKNRFTLGTFPQMATLINASVFLFLQFEKHGFWEMMVSIEQTRSCNPVSLDNVIMNPDYFSLVPTAVMADDFLENDYCHTNGKKYAIRQSPIVPFCAICIREREYHSQIS